MQLTNILRDVPEDLRRGRVYIPREDLRANDVTEADLKKESDDPKGAVQSGKVKSLLRQQAARAREYYARAARELPPADARRLVAAEIMGAVYRAILDRIEQRDYDVFSSVVRVPRPRRALIAATTWAGVIAGKMTAAMAPDVVVVGAGFAGLSAAALLSEAGRRVLVLDARPQLGGRATAFIDRHTGELVDNGQHVLFGCYHETFDFLRRVGAEDNVLVQSSMTIPYLDARGRRSELRCPRLPPPLHLLAAVLDWDALRLRDRLSVLKMARPILAARKAIARDRSATLTGE